MTPLTCFSLGMARVVYKSKYKTALEYDENYAGCRTVAVEARLLVKPRGVHLQGGLHPHLTEGNLPCEPGNVLPPCPLNGALEVCSHQLVVSKGPGFLLSGSVLPSTEMLACREPGLVILLGSVALSLQIPRVCNHFEASLQGCCQFCNR